MIPCMYRKKVGKKGEERFSNKYSELMIYAKFCPFTGKPLYDEKNEESKVE